MTLDDVVLSIQTLQSNIEMFTGLVLGLLSVLIFSIAWGQNHV